MKLIKLIIIISLLLSCATTKPPTFIESHDEAGVWKSIYLHNHYGVFTDKNKEVWRRVVDVLSEKYDLEVLDKTSGYIRTSWKYMLPDEDNKYRSRVIIKMLGNVWHTTKLKTEAQLFENGTWITGYDTAILEEIYKDLQGRIGTSVR
ncbi:MAG TPA: hypothetical protein ENK59_00875 [Thioploca sp.]|nr:hypothetical protein [Thioploca sp.]